jgi:membrane associated rhomboid family serine protease
MGINLTPVVKNLLIINVLVFIIFNVVAPQWFHLLPLYYPEKQSFLDAIIGDMVSKNGGVVPPELAEQLEELSPTFKPYQVITSMFTHFDGQHIFFNMLSLVIFGSNIEAFWGSKRFLFYYLVAGVGAATVYLIMTYVSVHYSGGTPFAAMAGASGCIFGLLAAYGMLFPENVIQLLLPPVALKAKYYVMIFGALEFYGGIRSLNPNLASGGVQVAHFAHLGGALFGILLILYWNKGGKIGRD